MEKNEKTPPVSSYQEYLLPLIKQTVNKVLNQEQNGDPVKALTQFTVDMSNAMEEKEKEEEAQKEQETQKRQETQKEQVKEEKKSSIQLTS